jgi:aquaporin Z
MTLGRTTGRALAELLGTMWLVLGGCGTAVLAGHGVGTLGVALAFGLTVVTMAYAVGRVSGGHFNPAVTVGMAAAGRFPARDVPVYLAAQVAGGVLGGAVLMAIASGLPGFDPSAGFASNGFGAHSPGGYSLAAAFVCEVVMTGMFLVVILGVSGPGAPANLAPLAIGLTLTLIHLISIPVTNTSVNPARSTGVAVFQAGWAVRQLWLFWLAPFMGALLAGVAVRMLAPASAPRRAPVPVSATS